MRRTLYFRLALAFMLVAILTAALMALFIRLTSADRLSQLILDQQRSNIHQSLTSFYLANGSWEGVGQNWRQIQSQAVPTSSAPTTRNFQGGPPDRQDRRNLFGLADASGVVIIATNPSIPEGTRLSADQLKAGTPIQIDGQTVGTVLEAAQPPEFNQQENLFLERTNQALLLAVGAALLVALVVGILLARTLTSPLQALTRAAQGITEGHLEQQVNVQARDEIGQLASAFNRMSQEVARVNRLRRQMTADIAHDLRTPLTVIGGYVESMRDGVLSPTPERLALIYAEIERLQRLVGDLRMLSQVDAGELPFHPDAVSPHNLLERAVGLYQHHAEQQQIRLLVNAPADLPQIQVDETRMMQVMDNLLGNALRYTPAGGEINLQARALPGKVQIIVSDTGSGIAPEELPHVFDRFYRADKSRHSETGESGLGLAIVKALVEMQKGKVWAESEPGKGTLVTLEFPA